MLQMKGRSVLLKCYFLFFCLSPTTEIHGIMPENHVILTGYRIGLTFANLPAMYDSTIPFSTDMGNIKRLFQ